MIIGIDGNEANVTNKVGVSVHAINLLNYFQKQAGENLRFVVFLRETPNDKMPKENSFYKYEVVKGTFLWSQLFLPIRLLKKDSDIFYTPAHYAPRFCPVPLVVTIHDLSHFYYPNEFLKKDLYKLTNWTKYSVQKAVKVIAVSENTKKDLIKFYNLPEDKVQVIHNGYEKSLKLKIKNYELNKNSKLKIKNYILYVGTLQPRKNVPTLITAFNTFQQENPEFNLIIVGKKGWLYDKIFNLVRDLKLENKVEFAGHVTDKELVSLYKNAFCLVLPSFYEGFGIPILEAMANQCPVISSNTSSLPEVGGDACLYFDPNEKIQLINQLKRLNDDNDLRKDLIQRGLKRIKLFSWQKCAQETLEVLRKAYEN